VKIQKFVSPVSQGNISGAGAVIFSLFFIGVGLGILNLCQVIPLKEFSLYQDQAWWMIQLPNTSVPRWTLSLVGVIFSLAGLSVFLSGMIDMNQKTANKISQRRNPSSPWLWDFNWKYGKNLSRAKTKWWAHLIGITILAGFHGIAWSIASQKNFQGEILIFPIGISLFTLLIFFIFYINSRRQKAHSKVKIQLEHFPIRLNSSFSLYISGLNYKVVKKLEVKLRAVEEIYSYEKNKSSVKCRIQYSEEREIDINSDTLNLDFELPATANISTRLSERPAKFWEIHLYSNCDGPDLDQCFFLPIY